MHRIRYLPDPPDPKIIRHGCNENTQEIIRADPSRFFDPIVS
jgi:hypothetical protein